MLRRSIPIAIIFLLFVTVGCSRRNEAGTFQTAENDQASTAASAATYVRSNAAGASQVATAIPPVTATAAPTPEPSATATTAPTATLAPTATPQVIPTEIVIERLSGLGPGPGRLFTIEHPFLGAVYVLDELNVDTPLKISWTDDNPQQALVRYRNANGVLVELRASIDGDLGTIPIASAESDVVGRLPRHSLSLNSSDIFSTVTEVERLATIEITDADDNRATLQLLLSRHDYEPGYSGPMALAHPLYDQLRLGPDWRSERYVLQGRFADWLNEHPELWDRVTIEIEDRDPFSWQELRKDGTRLQRELTTAAYKDQVALYYVTADGQRQRFALDSVPYYTKFELVHSPQDEHEFYTLRAGRDEEVSQEMLEQMGDVIRHMFTNRPNYLHQLAENGAIHSVAPGEDLRALPEVLILEEEVGTIVDRDDTFGLVIGIAVFERHPELSVSAGYYFEHDVPVRGYAMMHEIVHQVQYMIYGSSWSESVVSFYENYMALPARQRIPDIAYHETSPWEWDALLTSAWFSQGSDLYEHVQPYLDLEVGGAGTTIQEYLQMRWGDPLPALESLE